MFGSAAKQQETKTGNIWSNPPDFQDVREATINVGIIEAEIEALELEISEIERKIKQGSRKSDVNEEAKEATKEQRKQLANTKARLAVAKAHERWFLYWQKMYLGMAYKER